MPSREPPAGRPPECRRTSLKSVEVPMLKMTAHGVAFAVATLLVFAGPAFAQKSGNVRADIEKANEAFAAAFAKGDAAAIAAMYSGDAQVFPPNSDVIAGSAAIQKLWQGAMGMGVKTVKLQ